MEKIIRVLVVDDSAYIRKVMKQMLQRSPFIEVVGAARDGKDALEKVEELQPDVITLDLIMPEMNGVEFLKEQMKRKPIPVIISSIASETGTLALEALDAGAVDFIQKPTALATDKVFEITNDLLEKVKAAASIPAEKLLPGNQETQADTGPIAIHRDIQKTNFDAVVIGVSTGGPQALRHIMKQFPKDFPVPIAIVLHMPVGYTQLYAERLNDHTDIEIVEAREGLALIPGRAILAKAGRHLTFEKAVDGSVRVKLETKPFDKPHRPSVDVLFQSAAQTFGKCVLGVVLTGMGSDGLEGAGWIKSNEGTVITQNEDSCVVYGMPRSVDEAMLSDFSLPLEEIVPKIIELI
jgi:two-component system chemotaxis response regulator CheB